MSIKQKLQVIFWLFFIVFGLFLAVNGFEQHIIYSIIDKKYTWDWSFLSGLLISATGFASLLIWLKEKQVRTSSIRCCRYFYYFELIEKVQVVSCSYKICTQKLYPHSSKYFFEHSPDILLLCPIKNLLQVPIKTSPEYPISKIANIMRDIFNNFFLFIIKLQL